MRTYYESAGLYACHLNLGTEHGCLRVCVCMCVCVYTGTLYLAQSKNGHEFLKRWLALEPDRNLGSDQDGLGVMVSMHVRQHKARHRHCLPSMRRRYAKLD